MVAARKTCAELQSGAPSTRCPSTPLHTTRQIRPRTHQSYDIPFGLGWNDCQQIICSNACAASLLATGSRATANIVHISGPKFKARRHRRLRWNRHAFNLFLEHTHPQWYPSGSGSWCSEESSPSHGDCETSGFPSVWNYHAGSCARFRCCSCGRCGGSGAFIGVSVTMFTSTITVKDAYLKPCG